jgi:hypothetical protein
MIIVKLDKHLGKKSTYTKQELSGSSWPTLGTIWEGGNRF